MRNFCFEFLQPYADGMSPAFPEGITFLLIADYRDSPYGLYAWRQTDVEAEKYNPPRPANQKLASLIYSAYGYPPALAIARSRIEKHFKEATPDIAEFEAAYTTILETLLAEVATAGYFMAAAQKKEIGYLRPGEWYWLLGVDKSKPVNVFWVSDDYFIYKNPASDFSLTDQQTQALKETASRSRSM